MDWRQGLDDFVAGLKDRFGNKNEEQTWVMPERDIRTEEDRRDRAAIRMREESEKNTVNEMRYLLTNKVAEHFKNNEIDKAKEFSELLDAFNSDYMEEKFPISKPENERSSLNNPYQGATILLKKRLDHHMALDNKEDVLQLEQVLSKMDKTTLSESSLLLKEDGFIENIVSKEELELREQINIDKFSDDLNNKDSYNQRKKRKIS